MEDNKLESQPIGKLFLKLAAPAILAQIINALYNIVDRMYIGHIKDIGAYALTGVGICFPILMIISAFAALVGNGGAPIAAIKMGEKDNKSAEKIMGNCFSLLIVISIILTVVFSLFKKDILLMFGGNEETISYAVDYIGIYLLGTVFVQISLGLNAFINTQGFAKTGMLTVLIGAVSNIILDPIFIYVFNMGVKGAALATIISQGISAFWVLKFLFGKKTILRFRKKNFIIDRKIILPVLALGISPFIMQSTESLVSIVLNVSLEKYGGTMAVGAMTVMSSIMQMVFMPLQGMGQGAQPIISYNYGAKRMDRVKKTFKLFLMSSMTFTIITWLFVMIFPGVFVNIFSNTAELYDLTVWGLRIYMAMVFLIGAQMACQQTFVALGQAKVSLFLALLRKVILLIPFVLILPNFFSNKVFGVFLAEPVADFIAVATTVIMFIIKSKKLFKVNIQQNNE